MNSLSKMPAVPQAIAASALPETDTSFPSEEEFDFVNLTTKDTGIDGTVFIWTAIGKHGPRVKWFPGRPTREGPCLVITIGGEGRTVAHGLGPSNARQCEAAVRRWIELNQRELLDFWHNGLLWTRDEVAAFAERLHKLG